MGGAQAATRLMGEDAAARGTTGVDAAASIDPGARGAGEQRDGERGGRGGVSVDASREVAAPAEAPLGPVAEDSAPRAAPSAEQVGDMGFNAARAFAQAEGAARDEEGVDAGQGDVGVDAGLNPISAAGAYVVGEGARATTLLTL